jgi:hypothetical protein
VITLFSVFIIVSRQVQEQKGKEESLLASIKALKETEQRLILTQDRLSYARGILDMDNASNEIFALKEYVKSFPNNISMVESGINVDSFNTKLTMINSNDLTNLLSKMYSSQMFSEIVLTSFLYSNDGSYVLNFHLTI